MQFGGSQSRPKLWNAMIVFISVFFLSGNISVTFSVDFHVSNVLPGNEVHQRSQYELASVSFEETSSSISDSSCSPLQQYPRCMLISPPLFAAPRSRKIGANGKEKEQA